MRMIHTSFLMLVVLSLIYCSSKITKIEHYGILDNKNSDKIVNIEPNNFESFDHLVDRIEEVSCNDSIPTIKIKDNRTDKIIGLANSCWDGVGCMLIKRRNVLKIHDDKINSDAPLDSLESFILKHYNNYKASNMFSESPNKALVSISYKEKRKDKLKWILNRIVTSHSTLNLEGPLRVLLEREIPPPPPAPRNMTSE